MAGPSTFVFHSSSSAENLHRTFDPLPEGCHQQDRRRTFSVRRNAEDDGRDLELRANLEVLRVAKAKK
jgi:hypothetical protein